MYMTCSLCCIYILSCNNTANPSPAPLGFEEFVHVTRTQLMAKFRASMQHASCYCRTRAFDILFTQRSPGLYSLTVWICAGGWSIALNYTGGLAISPD